MSTTYQQPGDVLTLVAPVAGVTNGVPVILGGLFVIPNATASSGNSFTAYVTGVHAYTKTASQAWTLGQAIYWNTSTSKFDSDGSTGPFVGIATEAVADGAGDTTGYVRLGFAAASGSAASGIFVKRTRNTVSEVNAGATLLPALSGIKYRMIDCIMISVGGAAGAVTTVDVIGTLSTARKLVAAAQAGLTRSTVVRAGDATGAVLADGASFTANDVNTAITIGKTGSSVTTATHIDTILTYAMDPG